MYFVYFGLKEIFGNPHQVKESFTPFFAKGMGGVFVAMGLTFITFEGYDLITTVAEEIKSPEKNIPKATFIALGVTIIMFLLILFVSLAAINPGGMPSWEFLGKFKETAIVRAAENFMPADGVIRFAPCDLMMLKIGESNKIENCFLPTAGGPNAELASTVLNAIAKDLNLTVTAGFIVREEPSPEQIEFGSQSIKNTLANLDPEITRHEKLIKSKSIAGGIAKTSREYDLVVIGAAKEPLFQKMLFGEIPEKVARFSPTSVLVVKRYEGIVKNILKKVLG